MKLKNIQKPITMAKYDALMGRLITKYKGIPVHECVIKLLEEASKYHIIDSTITRTRSKRSTYGINPTKNGIKQFMTT